MRLMSFTLQMPVAGTPATSIHSSTLTGLTTDMRTPETAFDSTCWEARATPIPSTPSEARSAAMSSPNTSQKPI